MRVQAYKGKGNWCALTDLGEGILPAELGPWKAAATSYNLTRGEDDQTTKLIGGHGASKGDILDKLENGEPFVYGSD